MKHLREKEIKIPLQIGGLSASEAKGLMDGFNKQFANMGMRMEMKKAK